MSDKFLFIELIWKKNRHRICEHKRFIGLSPNPYYNNIIVGNIQVLFAKLGVAEYHYAKHNKTAKQYHPPRETRRIKLRDFP